MRTRDHAADRLAERWSGPAGALQRWRKSLNSADAGIAMFFLAALILGAIIASFYERAYYP
jgi:hypothetical protein